MRKTELKFRVGVWQVCSVWIEIVDLIGIILHIKERNKPKRTCYWKWWLLSCSFHSSHYFRVVRICPARCFPFISHFFSFYLNCSFIHSLLHLLCVSFAHFIAQHITAILFLYEYLLGYRAKFESNAIDPLSKWKVTNHGIKNCP